MEIREKVIETLENAKKIVFGQDNLLESIVAALVCEGHLLIEGMPGLAKTLSVSALSKLCDLSFKRIQFTPDLLPSDLLGTMVYAQSREEFTVKFGPIFTQILLADEVNRAPAKVQAAMLEAMAERQVTIGDTSHKLSAPFVVLATQNPIDQEGTYPLPEAQMDRFMMKVSVDYPSYDAEKEILNLPKDPLDMIEPMLTTDDILSMQEVVQGVYVDEKIKKLIVDIVQATRPGSRNFLKEYDGGILAGASPRASLWLFQLGKYRAFFEGKDFVSPEHLFKVIPFVLQHRIILTYEATIDRIKPSDVAVKIAQSFI